MWRLETTNTAKRKQKLKWEFPNPANDIFLCALQQKLARILKGSPHQKECKDEGTAESLPDARMNKDMEEMVRARAIHEMKFKDVDKGNEREETGFKVGRLDRQTDRYSMDGATDLEGK